MNESFHETLLPAAAFIRYLHPSGLSVIHSLKFQSHRVIQTYGGATQEPLGCKNICRDENARTHILETFLYDNLESMERLRYWTLASLICIVRIVALIIIIVIGYCIRELLDLSSLLIVRRVASISSPTELQPRHNIVMGLLCGFCIVLCENVSWLEYFRRII